MIGADLVERIDAVIRELETIKGEIAASKGDASPMAANGAGGEATLVRLRVAAVELGARISGDDRVSEAVAASLLGCEPQTLGKQRLEGRAPPSYRVPVGGSRISYKLSDLARWLEERREDF